MELCTYCHFEQATERIIKSHVLLCIIYQSVTQNRKTLLNYFPSFRRMKDGSFKIVCYKIHTKQVKLEVFIKKKWNAINFKCR